MVVGQRRTAALGTLVFGSGLCALVYQVTWLRELRLVFGASTPASAAVLAVFMGGLGVGGLVLGRRAERSPHPLAFFGRLEIATGITAGLSPWLIAAARALYLAAGGTATLGVNVGSLLRLLLTALVLGAPVFFMGGTLPAVARAATASADRARRSLGWLYGCNTLGAVAGATLTTFVMLEGLGQRKSLWLAALAHVLLGMVALSLARRGAGAPAVAMDEQPPVQAPVQAPEAASASPHKAPLALVLAAAALVGFAFFLMELVWYRMLAPLLGGTTYTFGIILILALAGIGAGGLLYGARARRRPASLGAFAATCGLEALFLVAPLALGYRLAVLASNLRGLGALGFGGLIVGWLVVGGLVVLPASLVAGYQFPLLVALLGRGRRGVAAHTGLVAASNTAGAIAGSLAGGFGLVPLLGAPAAWRGTTLLLAALALAAAALERTRGATLTRSAGAATAVVAALLCLAPGPGALWRFGEIGAGRRPVTASTPNELKARVQGDEVALVWEEDGRESSVAVQAFSGYSFSINGKTDGHIYQDASTQVMSGLVGAALHPQPRRALVIGLGTGSTAGWLAAVPGMESVDVVELEHAVVRVARDCAPANRDVLDNPRVHLTIGDGRELMLTSGGRWDLIVSEPSNPFRAGVASLFTTEFYRATASRLAGGGLFLQWLQAYEVDAEVVSSVYTSLASVFPSVETWALNNGDLLLVASLEPLRHDVARERARLAREPFARALADTWGVGGAEGLYTGFVAGPGLARRLGTAGAQPNVDDLPVVEFGFARGLGQSSFSIDELRRAARPAESRPAGTESVAWEQTAFLRAARGLMLGEDGPPATAGPAAQRSWLARQWHPPGFARTAAPISLVGLLLEAETLADRGDARAAAIARGMAPDRPVEAAAILGRLAWRRGDRQAAVEHLRRAFIGYREDPWPWAVLMQRTLPLVVTAARDPAAARRLLPAVSEPFAVRMLEVARLHARATVAVAAGGDVCRAAFHDLEPNPFWDESFLRQRATCYWRFDDPLARRAAGDLERFVADRSYSVAERLRSSAEEAGASADEAGTSRVPR